MSAATCVPTFFVTQEFAVTTTTYEVVAADGSSGALLGSDEDKHLASQEEVTCCSDATTSRTVLGFEARKLIDLDAAHDVTDESGGQIGFFGKDFGASLLRSTCHVEGPGLTGTDRGGAALLGVERPGSVRDRCTVHVPDQRVDVRVAAAVAVGADALMQR